MASISLLLLTLLAVPALHAAWTLTPQTTARITRPRFGSAAFAKSMWEKNFDEMQEIRRLNEEARNPPPPKLKSRYVPPELWNQTVDIMEDEKIRFDSLKYGNQWQQNEILRKNLGS
jgi:hypothetical protein